MAMVAKKIEKEEITRQARKMTGILVQWYLTGELEFIIKELEDVECRGSSKDIVLTLGNCKKGFIKSMMYAVTRKGSNKQARLLKESENKMDTFFKRLKINPNNRKYYDILKSFYRDGHKIDDVAVKIGFEPITVKKYKRNILDRLISYLRAG